MSGEPYPERNEPRVAEADPAATKAATVALVWTLAFIALHVYWFMGGRVGFGDQTDPLPGWPWSVGGWIFSVVVDGMWIAGLVVPSALAWPWGRRLPHRLLVRLMWVGAIVLLARGGAGFVDDALRFSGLYGGGLTGLSTKDVLGSAHPSTYTKLSTVALDSIFFTGGVLFGRAARLAKPASRPPMSRSSESRVPYRESASKHAHLWAPKRAAARGSNRGAHSRFAQQNLDRGQQTDTNAEGRKKPYDRAFPRTDSLLEREAGMPGISRLRLGVATSVWGVVFAIVHFYWAFGGSAGTDWNTPSLGASLYIAFIAVLGLLGAAVAHGLSRSWVVRVQRRRLLLLARIGAIALLLGVAFGVARWIATGSIGGNGAAGFVITAYFLLGGLLFSTLGWHKPGRLALRTPARRDA